MQAGQERPFYYYQGEPIYLEPDFSTIVVAARPQAVSATAVGQWLTDAGVSLGAVRTLPTTANHTVYEILGGHENVAQAIQDLRARPNVDFAMPRYAVEGGADTLTFVNELVVDFQSGVDAQAIDSLVAAVGSRIARYPIPDFGVTQYRITYPRGTDPLGFAASVSGHPLVRSLDPNKRGSRYPLAETPSDPYYGEQYYFNNRANPFIDINIEPAWDVTLGEGVPSLGGIKVAVIDEGVEADHPDFGGQVLSNYAYDAWGNHAAAADPDCGDDAHGTAVAGIILGQHDNGEGIAGGAPGVRVVPIRHASKCIGTAPDADIATAIRYAWYYVHVDVINASWYLPHLSNAVTDAIADGVAQGRYGNGTTIVFAAGNTSDRPFQYEGMTYPGDMHEVIGVGAIDRDGNAAAYTPRSNKMDIVALSGRYIQAGDVFTTDLTGNDGYSNANDDDPDYHPGFTGTSAAAPQVAAAAALLYAIDPNLTETEVRSLLLNNADYWGRSDDFGAGKLNVGSAVAELVPPLSVSINGPAQVYSNKECSWTSAASGGSPPYQYTWYRGGGQVGTGTGYTANSGTNDFLLELKITDNKGATDWDRLNVDVVQDWLALQCEV